MRLIIQIPCLNEAEHLPVTLAKLPRQIAGIDSIEVLVIDDGSNDNTGDIARQWGVQHIVRHRRNRGLAAAFQNGVDRALAAGADIIVNTDADGQYEGEDIVHLVQPILRGEADIVVGDRGVADNAHFGPFKRRLQRLGSFVVRRASGTTITDAVSGFRAISREAAQRITITTEFSYTTDMLIQAGRKRLAIASVPIRTHKTERPSRLFKSIPRFITHTAITITRAYTTHNALRVFVGIGLAMLVLGALPVLRFTWFYLNGEGDGHVQSLVIGGSLMMMGTLVSVMGILADLIATNRKLMEQTLFKLRKLEEKLGETESDAQGQQEADTTPDLIAIPTRRSR
ncbi:glycosyltransferase family 2 protein [Croceicoccus naphthovorans]|uniref:Glycosyl transferase n=1 Tax=Croceicoccus naphthovorans TaxID=1348774 RepID=A0A0G3XM38_9SPHN|nr:glycosyltransferase family 2 protein [Croceicoccus naphthovorans]AKM11709.1 glycosyl transferase [Croceicoccus naphthovorans]MBB3990621.1 glycosyltransferase involved in cell wall biosynthesis [Croceicoccus naphthovorans]